MWIYLFHCGKVLDLVVCVGCHPRAEYISGNKLNHYNTKYELKGYFCDFIRRFIVLYFVLKILKKL